MVGCKTYRLLGCRVILQVIPYIRGFHILIPEIVWPLISHEGSLNAATGEGRSFLEWYFIACFRIFWRIGRGIYPCDLIWLWNDLERFVFSNLKICHVFGCWSIKYSRLYNWSRQKVLEVFLFAERVWCFSFKFTQYWKAKRLAPCVKKERHFDCRTLD